MDLIERLKKATGPDRQLDWEIHCRDGVEDVGMYGAHPAYTASVDAALGIMPELVYLEIETGTQRASAPSWEWPMVMVGSQVTGNLFWDGQAKNLPITLCIAALKAREVSLSKGEL